MVNSPTSFNYSDDPFLSSKDLFFEKIFLPETDSKISDVSLSIFSDSNEEDNRPLKKFKINQEESPIVTHIPDQTGILEQNSEFIIDEGNLLNLDFDIPLLELLSNPIDEIFVINLSKNPPLPLTGINNPKSPLIQENIHQFIDCHLEETEKEALRYMISQLDYVSFDDFKKTLYETIDKAFLEIGDAPYLLMAEWGKSNKWVAELALSHISNQPHKTIHMSFLSNFLMSNPFNESYKKIVLFDDAAYSGEQMERFVKLQMEALKTNTISNFEIHIIIPYATKIALNRFNKLKAECALSFGGKIQIHTNKIMEAAEEKLSKNALHLETLYSMYYPQIEFASINAIVTLFANSKAHEYFRSTDLDYTELIHNSLLIEIINVLAYTPAESTKFLKQKKESVPEDFKKLLELAQNFNEKILSKWHENFLGLEEDEFKKLRTSFEAIFWERGFSSRALTIFDHKVADRVSLPPCLQTGEVWSKGIIIANPLENNLLKPLISPIFIADPPYKIIYI